MTTEQYQIGYEEGYQEGWNAAMDDAKVAANKKNFSLHVWNNGNTVVWPKFLPEFKSKICKHEDDGFCYTSNHPKYKCKICGEFFRNQQVATKAAPQQAAQEPFGWACWIGEDSDPRRAQFSPVEPLAYSNRKPLYTAPHPAPTPLSERDTELIQKMLEVFETLADKLPENRSTIKTCYAINDIDRDNVHLMVNLLRKRLENK